MKTIFFIISLFVFVNLQGQFKDSLLYYLSQYENYCYKDSIKVCKFACYTLTEDGQIRLWGEFDCEYYREYQSIYYCTDRYNKWVHLNEPTLKGFMEFLKNK